MASNQILYIYKPAFVLFLGLFLIKKYKNWTYKYSETLICIRYIVFVTNNNEFLNIWLRHRFFSNEKYLL